MIWGAHPYFWKHPYGWMLTKISQAFSLGNVATGATQVRRRTALNELNEVETFCVVANQYVKPHRFSCILILEKTNPLSIAGILSWNYRHCFFNKLTNEVPSIKRKCIFQTSWNNIYISWKCEWTSRIRDTKTWTPNKHQGKRMTHPKWSITASRF